jgi:hypothetical protein
MRGNPLAAASEKERTACFPPFLPSRDSIPLVVHFPIALLIVAPLFILAGLIPYPKMSGFHISALVLMALETIGALFAVWTGEAASDLVTAPPVVMSAVESHIMFPPPVEGAGRVVPSQLISPWLFI